MMSGADVWCFARELPGGRHEQPHLAAAADRGLRPQEEEEDQHRDQHQTDTGEALS